jgi:uncharacterized protein YukE
VTNPLISDPLARPAPAWAGVWPAEDIELIAAAVRNDSWIEGSIGAAGAGLDALAMVSDPAGALAQYGVAWLIEHVRPLSEALDQLAGDPVAIAAQAQTWRRVAERLQSEADELAHDVRFDLSEWEGAAAVAYRHWALDQDRVLQALSRAAGTMAQITESAGLLIATVRMTVRDAIATVVSRLTVYAGELIATAGLVTPLVVEQVSTLIASWSARIARWLRDLIASLRNLAALTQRLGAAVQELTGGRRPAYGLLREGDGIIRNGRKILMTRQNVLAVARKYGIDMHGVQLKIDTLRRGGGPGNEFYGVTMPDHRITLARDAFTDEEQLARTLVHERFHVEELRHGLPYPMDRAAGLPYEARAYAHEERWWQEHKHLLEED